MPFCHRLQGGFRGVGLALALLASAFLVPRSSFALGPRPGLEVSQEVLDKFKDGIGKNFDHYRGRNPQLPAPSLRSGMPVFEPDPLQGNIHALALMTCSGNAKRWTTTQQDQYARLFSRGQFNDPSRGHAGSARDFYLENSYGALDIDGEVEGPFEIPTFGSPANEELIITSAIAAADRFVDYSQFDSNGIDGDSNSDDDDGFVDMLIIVHAGLTAQASGDFLNDPSARMIPFSPPIQTNDGVEINEAIIVPELGLVLQYINGGRTVSVAPLGDVGAVVHEMGHLFGLPDLYDTDFTSEGIGEWGVMGSGSWLAARSSTGIEFPGSSPAHHDSWCKYTLGWLNNRLKRVDTTGSYRLDAIATPPDLNWQSFLFWRPNLPAGSEDFPEYFLCEYKVNKANPGSIPSSASNYIFDATHPMGAEDRGLVVWHIDDSIGGLDLNDANRTDFHPRVMVVQADGNFDLQFRVNRGDSGDVFTHESQPPIPLLPDDVSLSPNTHAYDGTRTGISVRTVAFDPQSATLEFTLINVPPTIEIMRPVPRDVTKDDLFTILWTDSDPDDDAVIELYYSSDASLSSVDSIRNNATLIYKPLSEDEQNNRYVWNTYQDGPGGILGYVPEGQYYVYAIISDPQTALWTVSRGSLQVIHNRRPTISILTPSQNKELADTHYDVYFAASDDHEDQTTIELWATSDRSAQPSGGIRIMPPTPMTSFNNNFLYRWDTTNAVPGQNYKIYGIIDDGVYRIISNMSAGAVLVDHKPKLAFRQPGPGALNEATGTYVVKWLASDEEEQAEISIYFAERIDSHLNAILITAGLREGVSTEYVWDLREAAGALRPGVPYYIWGSIDDGVNPPVWVVSLSAFTVRESSGVTAELTDLIQNGQRIDMESPPTALVGFNLTNANLPITLDAILVQFQDVSLLNKIDPAVDFLPITSDSMGGVALYRDDRTNGLLPGEFDLNDATVSFRNKVIDDKTFLLIPENGIPLPADDVQARGSDFFLVVRTSNQLAFGDGFRAHIPQGGLFFSNGQDTKTEITTNPLYANIATFLKDLTPEDGEIKKSHEPIPVIALGMADGVGNSETLNQISLRVEGVLSQFDLDPLATTGGGVALYLDDGNGSYGPEDLAYPVLLKSAPQWLGNDPYNLILEPAVPIDVPDVQDGLSDLYVVIRASDTITPGHTLSVCVAPQGLLYSAGFSSKSLCTKTLTSAVNTPPTIRLTAPPLEGALADTMYTIQWEDQDPDDNARISLYYTTSRGAPFQKLITADIEEDDILPTSDAYDWNTRDVDPGQYYICALINDGANPSVVAISPGKVTVHHNYSISSNDLVVPGPDGLSWVEADSDPVAVLGVNLWDNYPGDPNNKLRFDGLTLEFEDASLPGSAFQQSDLEPLGSEANSGVMLYIDVGDQEGVFDIRDTVVPIAQSVWLNDKTVRLKFQTPQLIPTEDIGNSAGNDYFVAIRTSKTVEYGDRFRLRIAQGGISTNAGPQGNAVTSGTLAVNFPTFITDLAEPAALNQQGQPIHYVGEQLTALGIDMSDNGHGENFNAIQVVANEALEATWEWDRGGPWNALDPLLYTSRHGLGIGANATHPGTATTASVHGRDSSLLYDTFTVNILFYLPVDTDMGTYELTVSPPNQAFAGTFAFPNVTFAAGFRQFSLTNANPQYNNALEPRGPWTLSFANSGQTSIIVAYWDISFTRPPTFDANDLLPIDQQGISLWRDVDGDGVFNSEVDLPMSVQGTPYLGNAGRNQIFFDLSPVFPLPDLNDGKPDVFVVARPSATMSNGDTFYLEVQPYNIQYDGDEGPALSGKGGTSIYFICRRNVAPTFRFNSPGSGNANANRYFRIQWEDDDPDDNATISLFYDQDGSGFDGVAIPNGQNLPEDSDGVFQDQILWDTAQVEPGRYYIYAVVTDGVNDPVYVYSPGWVQVNMPVVAQFSDLSHPGQRIDATSPRTAVLGMNIYDQGLFEKIDGVTVEMDDLSGTASPTDLLAFALDGLSGIALYRDDGTKEGLFDNADAPVTLTAASWIQNGTKYFINLCPMYAEEIPDDATQAANYGDDFYVVIRTSDTIALNDKFKFAIPKGGVLLRNGKTLDGTDNKNAITANVPTFLSNTIPDRFSIGQNSQPTSVLGLRFGDTGAYNPDLTKINVGVSGAVMADLVDQSVGLSLLDVEVGNEAPTASWVVDFQSTPSTRDFRLMKAWVTGVQATAISELSLSNIFIDPRMLLTSGDVVPGSGTFTSQFTIRFINDTQFQVLGGTGDTRSDFQIKPSPNGAQTNLFIPSTSWRGDSAKTGAEFLISYSAELVRVGNIGENVTADKEEVAIRKESWLGSRALAGDWFSFRTVNGDFNIKQLLPMNASGPSGLSLWRDADGDGVFDASKDAQITLAKPPTQTGSGPWEIALEPKGGLPISSTHAKDAFTDLFVVAQTSGSISDGIVFNVNLPGTQTGNGVVYSIGDCEERIHSNPLEGRWNVPPTMKLTSPPLENATAVETYQITWEDFDPDDNAQITLYYTQYPAELQDLNLIDFGLSEDADGNRGMYTWQLGSVPAGNYWIVAKIDDGHNTPVWVVSDGMVSVERATVTQVTNLLPSTKWVESESEPIAALGLNLYDRGQNVNLESITVDIIDESTGTAGFDTTDLRPLGTESDSGLAIYADTGALRGVFDPQDIFLPLSGLVQWQGKRAVLNLAVPQPLSPNDSGAASGIDFFVVFRTSRSIEYADAFHISIPNGGVTLSNGTTVVGGVSSQIRSKLPVLITNLVASPTQAIILAGEYDDMLSIDASDHGTGCSLESVKVFFNDKTAGTVIAASRAFSDPGLPLDIPRSDAPQPFLSRVITVTNSLEFYNAELNVNITSVWRGLLQVSLQTPGNQIIPIFWPNTGSPDTRPNLVQTFVLPVDALTSRNAQGNWTLIVQNTIDTYTATLNSWSLTFQSRDQRLPFGFSSSDIMPLAENGVALWQDTDQNGQFDPAHDTPLPVAGSPYIGNSGQYGLKLTLATPWAVPDARNFTPDLFLVVRPSATMSNGDAFSVTIPSSGLVFNTPDGKMTTDKTKTSNPLEAEINVPPTLEFLDPPETGGVAEGEYTIRWTDSDPDDNANITLYYTSSLGRQGLNEIVSGLFENPDGTGDTYLWNVKNVLQGRYWIVAKIDDGYNAPVWVYSPGQVSVENAVISRVTNLIPDRKWVDADSDPFAVLGLNLYDRGQDVGLQAISLALIDDSTGNGSFEPSDLRALSGESSSGIALYRDNGLIEGVFDPADPIVSVAQPVWNGNSIRLQLNPQMSLPDNDSGVSAGNDFFIVLRTSRTIQFRDGFRVQIPDGGITLTQTGEPLKGGVSSQIMAKVPMLVSNLVTEPSQYLSVAGAQVPVFGIHISDNGADEVFEELRVVFNDETQLASNQIYSASFGTTVARAIPDASATSSSSGQLVSTLTIPEGIEYYGAILSVNVTHALRGDLKIVLRTPWSQDIPVFSTNRFDSGTTISATLRLPVETFPLRSAEGVWSLIVTDRFLGNTGTLNSWSLKFLMNADLESVGHGFNAFDLMSMAEGGVAIWEDVDHNGLFDETVDQPIALADDPFIGNSGSYGLLMQFLLPYSVPDSTNPLSDLFLVIRPSETISYGDSFSVTIPPGAAVFNGLEGRLVSEKTTTSGILTGDLNVSPLIELLTPPAGGARTNFKYTISWTDEDPDDNATINLFYTREPDSFANLTEIVTSTPLKEDPDAQADSYIWDVSGTDVGRYYIVASISDGHNPPMFVRSPGYLDITERINAKIVDLVITDPKTGVQWIEPDSKPTAVIGLNVSDLQSNAGLSAISLEFKDVSLPPEVLEATDLADLNAGLGAAVILYQDFGVRGVLDWVDVPIPLGRTSWATDSLKVTISPVNPPAIPDFDTGLDAGVDFIIAIRTSRKIEFGDRFKIAIPKNGLQFTVGRAGEAFLTKTLASAIPTFIQNAAAMPEEILKTVGADVDVLSIASGDNGRDMILESLKVKINDQSPFQGGTAIVFDASPLQAIPNGDPIGASSTIQVSPEFQYTRVRAFLSIQHSWRGELRANLLSPEGRIYNLYSGVLGDAGQNVVGWFDVPLSAQGYRNALGNWSLIVSDNVGGNYVGTLLAWRLDFTVLPGTQATGFTPSDLLPVAEGGVAVYADTNADGQFNPGLDQRLPVQDYPYIGDAGANTVLLKFDTPYAVVPDPNDATPDFFVVIRPSQYFGYNDRFSVSVLPGSLRYNHTPGMDLSLSSGASGESSVLVGRLNQPPYIRVLEPSGPKLAIRTFRITWEDLDLDDDAKIYLYFDKDNKGYDGKILPNGRAISENDETDGLNWDISQNNPDVKPGERYWIYAIITDGKITYRSEYSRGYIQIRATNPEDYLDYVKLHGDGFILSSGNYDIFLGRFLGKDVATDLEVTPDDTGYFVLSKDGHIETLGDAPDITMGDQRYVPTLDAVALQVNYTPAQVGFFDYGGYIGTSHGEILSFGTVSLDVSKYVPKAGKELTDILLDREQDGLYILYGDGTIDTFGNATAFSLRPRLSGAKAIALRLTPSGNGLYMLDNYGGFYSIGDAGKFSTDLPNFGFDAARGFIVSATNSGAAVMTGDGFVHPSSGLNVARDWNVFPGQDVFRDIEVLGGKKVAILDILEQIYQGLETENTTQVMQYISSKYLDENYNNNISPDFSFKNALQGYFDFFMVRQRRISPMENNPLITVAGSKAYATVSEDWSLAVPTMTRWIVGRAPNAVTSQTVAIPFTQKISWYLGRSAQGVDPSVDGMYLDILYDNRVIKSFYPLSDEETKLDYLGPNKSNVYQLTLTDRGLDTSGSFSMNLSVYSGYVFSASNAQTLWEFDLEDGDWKVTRTQMYQFMFPWGAALSGVVNATGEVGIFMGGFDFEERSMINDDGVDKISHLRYTGTALSVPGSVPEKAGIIDLTARVADRFTGQYPTSFDDVTVQFVKDIAEDMWVTQEPVVLPEEDANRTHVYAVKFTPKSGSSKPFGLIRVLAPIANPGQPREGIVIDWRYRSDFRID